MKQLFVRLKNRSYPIFIRTSSIQEIGPRIKALHKDVRDVFVVTDTNVAALYSQPVIQSLQKTGFRTELAILPSGEKTKSLEFADLLYSRMIEFHLKRDGWVVALGGGVIGDLAGFAASTYLRGVPFVQIPTTLLAQVDSSVGGKVGINHPLGKNLIGSFHQPKLVLIDPAALKTLDQREIGSGMAEVLKYSLIAEKDLFQLIEKHLDEIVHLSDMELLTEMIYRCCAIKARIVEKDETESHERRLLNFGHTLGHAVEALGGFEYYKHGEAILYGMHWATWISAQRGMLSDQQEKRIFDLIKRLPAPPIQRNIEMDSLIRKVQLDKKQSSEGIFLVLLERIGKAKIEKTKLGNDLIEKWWSDVQVK